MNSAPCPSPNHWTHCTHAPCCTPHLGFILQRALKAAARQLGCPTPFHPPWGPPLNTASLMGLLTLGLQGQGGRSLEGEKGFSHSVPPLFSYAPPPPTPHSQSQAGTCGARRAERKGVQGAPCQGLDVHRWVLYVNDTGMQGQED